MGEMGRDDIVVKDIALSSFNVKNVCTVMVNNLTMSTIRTITFHLESLNTKTRHLTMEIHDLLWDRHKDVAEFIYIIRYQPFLSCLWTPNDNTCILVINSNDCFTEHLMFVQSVSKSGRFNLCIRMVWYLTDALLYSYFSVYYTSKFGHKDRDESRW